MELVVLGINHETAPVHIREKLSLNEEQVKTLVESLVEETSIHEAYVLFTCNRTEFHMMIEAPNNSGCEDDLHAQGSTSFSWDRQGFLKTIDVKLKDCELQFALEDVFPHLYFMKNDEGLAHIFRVTAGLNSLVTGETEILGQVKKAYHLADEMGGIGSVFHALYQQALGVGKRIHRETQINDNPASVSYAAVKLAHKIFGDLSAKKVMLIGAGKMGELTAQHLVSQGINEICVLNRTMERAEKIANRISAKAAPYSQLHAWLPHVDIIITSTGAPHHIIAKPDVEKAMQIRQHAPIFLIDIAVPRDIDPRVHEIEGAHLYCIDDLEAVVDANFEARKKEAETAEMIIQEEVTEFLTWYKSRNVAPLISALKDKAEQVRLHELQKYESQLKNLSAKEKKAVEKLTKSMMNRLLKEPVLRMKKYAVTDQEELYGATLAQLFDLGEAVIPTGDKDHLSYSGGSNPSGLHREE